MNVRVDMQALAPRRPIGLLRVNWDDIRVFLRMADAGSLSRAARRLRVSTTTVWRRVANLETDLGGVRLFVRSSSGYVLTAEGRALAASLGGLAETIAAACEEILPNAGPSERAAVTLVVPADKLDAVSRRARERLRGWPGLGLRIDAEGGDLAADLVLASGGGPAPAQMTRDSRYVAGCGADLSLFSRDATADVPHVRLVRDVLICVLDELQVRRAS